MPFEVGQRIGEYEVQKLLGAGGMGRVYKVRNIISNREEAMKVLLPDFASEPELAARFMAEIRTLAGLEHPNIAQLRTAFQLQNEFVMIMELVEGATLGTLAAESKLPLDQVLDYSMQALSALGYAHGRGVTHRDIKPANIMVTSHGLVKLMDFGIAKSTNDMQLTRPGMTMGSVYYISPEQVTGGTVDARSDIYSFGVTLYEILTGRKPFEADSSYTVLHAQMNTVPTPPLEVNPSLPPALSGIVMHAMQKDPAARFQTAEEFRNALKALRAPQPVSQAQGFAAAPVPAFDPVAEQPGFAPVATQAVASAPVQPGFTPVAVAASAASPATGKSHRGLWIALGAVTAILALAAVATVLPRLLSTHANPKTAAVTTETQTPAVQPETAAQATAPEPVATPQTGAETPGAGAAPAVAANPPSPNSTSSSRPAIEAARPTAARVTPPAASVYASPASAPPSGPARPTPQEIRQAHNRLMNLDARADAVRSGVQQIRGQQQAQGLDIRGDILASMTRMNHLRDEANRALAQNDLQAAEESMGRAEAEAAKLEAFLGH